MSRYHVVRIPLDAVVSDTPLVLGGSRLFVNKLDGPAIITIGSNPPFELNARGKIISCDPLDELRYTVEDTVANGEIEILVSDTIDFDFLASSGAATGGDWEIVDVLAPHSVAVAPNIVSPNVADGTQAGAAVGFAYMRAAIASLPVPITRLQFGSAAGVAPAEYYLLRQGVRNHLSAIDYLFQPLGVTRDITRVVGFRTELTMIGRAIIAGGNNASFAFGYVNRVAGIETFGIGFFVSPLVTGDTNLYAGVIDYSGGAPGNWPLAATRIIWADTGIDYNDFRGTLTVEFGQDGGAQYISWLTDGVERYRHDGEFGASLGLAGAPTGEMAEGIKLYKGVIGDEMFCHMLLMTNAVKRV